MRVYLVVQWVDGIPETIKVYHIKADAERCAEVMGGKDRGLSVQEWGVD